MSSNSIEGKIFNEQVMQFTPVRRQPVFRATGLSLPDILVALPIPFQVYRRRSKRL
jgi:hypothetical protein